MALEWLSRILNGFNIQLGRLDTGNIWSGGNSDISSNILQASQLRKFTKEYTHELNVKTLNIFAGRLSEFSYAKEAVRRVNQQRDLNLNFFNSEIQALKNITIPDPVTPKFTSYERVGKRVQPWEKVSRPYSYGSGGGVYRWWIVNPQKKLQYQSEVNAWEKNLQAFNIYKENALSQIKTSLDIVTKKRDLITSTSFSL